MKFTNIIRFSIYSLALFSICSCRKVFNKAEWAPEASFPIAYSDLDIGNIITDPSEIKTDSNGLVSIVFKQKLDSLTLDVLDTFSAPPFYRNFKLDSLKLTVPPFKQRYSLGNLATALLNSDDLESRQFGVALIIYNGQKLSSIPLPLPPKFSVPIRNLPLSLNQFFQTAELKTGTMELRISNNLPLKIENMDFSIKNASDNSAIIQEADIAIDTNDNFSRFYDLAGKTVEGNLLVDITNLDLLTDRNARIDTSSDIFVEMLFSNLTVNSAIAVFPDQDVVTDRQAVSLENMGDLELKEAIIEDGTIVMDVKSTIQDSIFITYTMPKTTQNGVPLVFEGVVPPASNNQATILQLSVPVKDYLFNFSYPPDYFNRFYYEFRAHVKNTGKKVYLNLNDSIEVNVYLKSVRPKYVRGYLGSLDTTIAASVQTDLFSKIRVEQLSPENVKLNLNVENGLGVKGIVNFESLSASNASGEFVTATDPLLIGQDFAIAAATNPPFQESNTVLKSSPNSNFANLVTIFPNTISYKVNAKVGNLPKDTNNFVFSNSRLKTTLLIDVPLNISVRGLVLRDTILINPSQIEIENNGGVLRLLAYNGFPFYANIQLTFITIFGTVVVLDGIGTMEAGDLDPVTGKVKAKKFSKIEFHFDAAQLYLVSNSQKMVLEARFNTPSDQKVKIYSDYSAQLTLTAKVSPKVSR